jgi:hypothetical protein
MPYGDPYHRSTPSPTPHPPNYGQPPQWMPSQAGPIPPPVQAPPRKRKGLLGTVGALVLLLFIVALVGGNKSTTPQVPTTPTWGTATTSATPTPTAAPVPAPAVSEPAVIVQDAPLQPARKITARDWQLIAKNPDAHTGERIIVYGQVTQFDATTGTSGFRANVDGAVHKPSYGYADYDINTMLAGDANTLGNVVEKDLFKAEATVAGSLTYQTTLGGNLTVPQLTVTKIDVIGHVK